jgi:hypothetical protein
MAWLQGNDRSARGANRLNGGLRSVDLEIAPDDQSALSREG